MPFCPTPADQYCVPASFAPHPPEAPLALYTEILYFPAGTTVFVGNAALTHWPYAPIVGVPPVSVSYVGDVMLATAVPLLISHRSARVAKPAEVLALLGTK
jgi:hypothetical protein